MKLQISNQQWRLRIDEAELQRVRDGHGAVSVSVLPDSSELRIVLELAHTTDASVERVGDTWTFILPAADVDAYVQRLPCRDGMNFSFPVRTDFVLQLVFEVDVRDSVRHRGVVPRRH
ncbi:MAG: hypothetical protein ABI304_01250 [Rudaea sp.]